MNAIIESYFYIPSEHVMIQIDYNLDLTSMNAMDNPDLPSMNAMDNPDVI